MTQANVLAQLGSDGISTGFKNRIINGAMTIDQRNAGAAISTGSGYSVDRWTGTPSVVSKFSLQQNAGSVTPPVGFTNYLGATSSSAYSILTGDYFLIRQFIEGFNVADLGWGTANAKTVTLSFVVYSSLTGTFGGAIYNTAQNRSYPFTYTISSANTWTTVSITIPGDTSGTWLTTNGIGIVVNFSLGTGATYSGTAGSWSGSTYFSATGATSVVGTNGATFYITGVQLEVGNTATDFEYRPYGTELALCQRYCFAPSANGYYIGLANGSTSGLPWIVFPTTMRTTPTAVFTGSFSLDNGANGGSTTSASLNNATTDGARTYFQSVSGASWSQGQAINLNTYSARAMIFSAEL